jgi:hypothetical protein
MPYGGMSYHRLDLRPPIPSTLVGGVNFGGCPIMTTNDLWIVLAVVCLVIAICGVFYILATLT